MKPLLFTLLIAFGFTVHPNVKPHKELVYSEMVPADQRIKFCEAVTMSAERLHVDPDWLMVVFRFETAGVFKANTRNKYSGAVGLIQFIPSTAYRLGTTPAKLAKMTLVEQLVYVEKYFAPYAGKITDVYDLYLIVFAPAFLGRPNNTILYSANSATALGRNRYHWNRVLDYNNDGQISIRDVKRQIKKFVP